MSDDPRLLEPAFAGRPRARRGRSAWRCGRLRILVSALLIASSSLGFAQSESGRSASEWSREWSAARGSEDRRAVLARAVSERGRGGLAFLDSLAADGLASEFSREALDALALHPDDDLTARVLGLLEAETRAERRLELLGLLEGSTVHRAKAYPALTERLRRHQRDPLGLEYLVAIEGYAVRPVDEAMTERISSLLLEFSRDVNGHPMADAAWLVAMKLPSSARLPHLVAAVEDLHPHRAAPAARALLDEGIDGAEDLIVSAWTADPRRARSVGLERLVAEADRTLLQLRFLESLDAVQQAEVARIDEAVGAALHERLRPYLESALAAADSPGRTLFAISVLRSSRRSSLAPRLGELARAADLGVAVAAADAYAQITADERLLEAAFKRLVSGSPDEDVVNLDALHSAAPRSDRVRAWMRERLRAKGADWRTLCALIRAAGALGLPDLAALTTPHRAHKRWVVRLTVIEALIEDGGKAGLIALAECLSAERLRLARAAEEGLMLLTGKNHGRDIDAWRHHIARLPVDWKPLRLRPSIDEDDGRYGPRFYGLDIGSDHVVFVSDVSGSMQGAKLENLKEQLSQALTDLPSTGAFNLVFFNAVVQELWSTLRQAGKSARASGRDRIESLTADGGTNLWGGLELALGDQEADTIVLLSDGAPTAGRLIVPQEILDRTAVLNRHERKLIHCVFVTEGILGSVAPTTYSPLMAGLAAAHGGKFVVAN